MVQEQRNKNSYIRIDAAKKKTILYKLKIGEHVTTIPTIGFNKIFEYKGLNMNVLDIGGQYTFPLWRYFSHNTQGLIFFSSNDFGRIDEVHDALHKLLKKMNYVMLFYLFMLTSKIFQTQLNK